MSRARMAQVDADKSQRRGHQPSLCPGTWRQEKHSKPSWVPLSKSWGDLGGKAGTGEAEKREKGQKCPATSRAGGGGRVTVQGRELRPWAGPS